LVSVPEHPRILRAHAPITTWRKALFDNAHYNPATRVRRFGHLYGRQLLDALLPLEPWEQVHEPSFWCNDLDALSVYFIDVEQIPMNLNKVMPLPLMMETIAHGFNVLVVPDVNSRHHNNLYKLRRTVIDGHLTAALQRLSISTPKSILPPPPGHIIIRMPGHLGE
jgi:hypothetical protein